MRAVPPPHIGQLLHDLEQEIPLAAKFHDSAVTRKNDATVTTVDTVMRICECSRPSALGLMRAYVAIECALIVRGDRRTGNKTRLAWQFSLIAIGHAAISGRRSLAAE